MTNIYDWIVVGGGITGASLSYELVRRNLKVLLLEKNITPSNATRYSYGGLPYWSGTSPLTHQLCEEGIERHRHLSEELKTDTEYRELDLLLTLDPADNPTEIASQYQSFAITPQPLTIQESLEREPLLNSEAIAGSLLLPHGHIHCQKLTDGYLQQFQNLGGTLYYESVVQLLRQEDNIQGVQTTQNQYHSPNTVICAGGLSRSLLKETGISVPLYFTHAHLILTPPVDLTLRTLVMPAALQRFTLESQGSQPRHEKRWDTPGEEIVPPIFDPGAIQFQDRSLCLGQISQILTDPNGYINPVASEQKIRQGVGHLLPTLEHLPGTWHRCLVAFSANSLPLVGALPSFTGIYLFSGFTSTLLFAPPLAQHFAHWVTGDEDKIIQQLTLN